MCWDPALEELMIGRRRQHTRLTSSETKGPMEAFPLLLLPGLATEGHIRPNEQRDRQTGLWKLVYFVRVYY